MKHVFQIVKIKLMESAAHRKFYDFSEEGQYEPAEKQVTSERSADLFNYVNDNIIGAGTVFSSPFGPRKITYCDYVASGRSVTFIEDYIRAEVLPTYGSTHTTTSVTALQTTLFRHEARSIIRNAVRASEHDRIIFTGSGATGAMDKLIACMNFKQAPLVFVDCYAHHSSLLPWREISAEVIRVPESADGGLDVGALEKELSEHESDGREKIGCFTAASNITGIISPVDEVTILLHRYKALAIWDYATAAPYVDIVMNPIVEGDDSRLAYKDAIFFSLHKFVGGVQTPGVLIGKKQLFRNDVPAVRGGGSIFFVSRESHSYLKDVEDREEGGTPPIIETIRGGMVMQLKMSLDPAKIVARCRYLSRKLREFVKTVPQLIPLGNMDHMNRLPILSFMVRHTESGMLLHHNYVASLLNDLYGIQSRGGCACAGPYALDLLGIDEALAHRFLQALAEPHLDRSHLRRKEEHGNVEVLRPGFTRLILPFTATDQQVEYILEGVRDVCRHGWKLMAQYQMDTQTGGWKHHTNLVFRNRQWLQNISYANATFNANLKKVPSEAPCYEDCFHEAQRLFQEAPKIASKMSCADESSMFTGSAGQLLWFLLPSQSQKILCNTGIARKSMPFCPTQYPMSRSRCLTVWHSKEPSSNGQSMQDQKELVEATKSVVSQSAEKLVCFARSQLCGLKFKPQASWMAPPKKLFTATLSALQQFKMIGKGDKVLVCLSGGKDSLSLLHTLRQYQHYMAAKSMAFSLGAVTVDPQSSSYDPRPLIPYLASLSVPYFFEEQGILKQALQVENLNSICSFCSRMKRGRIYAAARREGYNVLAFGQHLDDLSESFLMSVFHNGRLRTMKAAYTVKEGDLRVIRPFVFVREKSLRLFAETSNLPIIPENCPACFEAPKERHRMKQLLAQEELNFPLLFWSLKTAMLPLLSIRRTGLENQMFGKLSNNNTLASSISDSEDE